MKQKRDLVVLLALVIIVSVGAYGLSNSRWFPNGSGGHKPSLQSNSNVDNFIHGKSNTLSGYDPAMNK
jgi:hypothetical protein